MLLVGSTVIAQQLAQEFAHHPWAGIQVIGCTSDDAPPVFEVPVLGRINDTPQLITRYQIHEVIFTLPPQQQDQIVDLSLQLHQQPVMLHVVPTALDLTFTRTKVETLGGIPLVSMRESALTEPQRLLKRLFDAAASFILLLLLLPLLVIIALLIKSGVSGTGIFLTRTYR